MQHASAQLLGHGAFERLFECMAEARGRWTSEDDAEAHARRNERAALERPRAQEGPLLLGLLSGVLVCVVVERNGAVEGSGSDGRVDVGTGTRQPRRRR